MDENGGTRGTPVATEKRGEEAEWMRQEMAKAKKAWRRKSCM